MDWIQDVCSETAGADLTVREDLLHKQNEGPEPIIKLDETYSVYSGNSYVTLKHITCWSRPENEVDKHVSFEGRNQRTDMAAGSLLKGGLIEAGSK